MGIVAILYWIWLLGAVAVLGYRIYGRATGQRSRVFEFRSRNATPDDEAHADEPEHDATTVPVTAPTSPAEPTRPAPVVATPDDATAVVAAPPADVAADQPASLDGLDSGEIHPSVLAAMRADQPDQPGPPQPDQPGQLDQLQPSMPAPAPGPERGRAGLFSDESRQAHQPLAVGTLAPLRETLTGITMPCDLVPLTDLGPRPTREQHRERLVLMTTSAGAGEVAARLADELERLGLDITTTSSSSCVARRQDRAVEIRVHEFPERITVDGAPSFPTTPDGSVVVELLAA